MAPEEQITHALRQAEIGTPVGEICRLDLLDAQRVPGRSGGMNSTTFGRIVA